MTESTGTRAFLTLARTLLGADAVLSFVWLDETTAVVRHVDAGTSSLAESLEKDPLIVSVSRAELEAGNGIVFEARFPRLWVSSALRRRLPGPPAAVLVAGTSGDSGVRAVGGLLAIWLLPESRGQPAAPVQRCAAQLRQPLTVLLASDGLDGALSPDAVRCATRDDALDDELTGLLTRRGFELLVDHELLVARRMRRPDALLLIDIDDLKSVNERFGRAAGDELLRVISRLLRDTARDSDIVARMASDEFAVFALECEGSILADRITAAVAARNARATAAGGFAISVSIGVAPSTTGEEYDVVMAEAAAALAQTRTTRYSLRER